MSLSSISALAGSPAPQQTQELSDLARAKAAKLKGAALNNASPAEQRAAVAAQFESILVRQLLGDTMTKMMGGGTGGVSGSIYGDMLADTLSQQLSAGQGIGLGRFLEQQLTPRGEVSNPKNP
jgi:Rod binding domain-containing protein